MINSFVIDDEASARTVLINMLEKYCPDVAVKGKASSYSEAIQYLPLIMDDIDALFIDVDLGSDKTGFDILNKMQGFRGSIIFVTAYEEYALKAFRYSAVNYLTKPISPYELVETTERLKKKAPAPPVITDLRQPIEKLPVYIAGKWELIHVKHITYIQASGSYSNIYVLDAAKPHVVSKPIKYFEGKLAGNKEFVRIQKSFLINQNHIYSVSRSDYTVELNNRMQIPVGGGKYRAIMRQLLGN
jgi:two-component system LytT family response regulator